MPRNCDVGTPEEQEGRFQKFCSKYEWLDVDGAHCTMSCPLYKKGDSIVLCSLTWAQFPYDGGCDKDKETRKATKNKKAKKENRK